MSDEYDPFDPNQDLIPQNPLQEAQIRDLAQNGAENLQFTARQMQENAAAMGRWILASLLTMNTGGAVAVLSVPDKVVGPLGEPLVAFAIGAVLALATGINGLVTSLRAGPIIGDAIEALRLSVFESTIHASTKQKIRSLRPVLKQQIAISSVLAITSLGSFAMGIAFALA